MAVDFLGRHKQTVAKVDFVSKRRTMMTQQILRSEKKNFHSTDRYGVFNAYWGLETFGNPGKIVNTMGIQNPDMSGFQMVNIVQFSNGVRFLNGP